MSRSSEAVSDEDPVITADELALYRSHVGRGETRRQWLDVESLRRFAAAVGAGLDVEREMPPLAHWAYFLECVASTSIGVDGHPDRADGVLPAVRLPRRMFAASTITFVEPMILQREAELKVTVAGVNQRSGKSGDLILIDVDRLISQEGRARISERQTLVYAGRRRTAAVSTLPSSASSVHGAGWVPSTVELMRFSAVTFNAHRIHYDLPYAQAEEGYPGLVVHGPLTAAKLFAFSKPCHGAAAQPRTFRFRALAPLFAGQQVRFEAGGVDGRIDAIRCDGAIAMSAQWISDQSSVW